MVELSLLKKYSSPTEVLRKGKALGYDIHVSTSKNKKYMVIHNGKKVHFGTMSPPTEDYTKHKNKMKRRLFRLRNHKWATADKFSPAYLAYTILW